MRLNMADKKRIVISALRKDNSQRILGEHLDYTSTTTTTAYSRVVKGRTQNKDRASGGS
jgi:Trp operon repressor